jgi:hypothetical protein
LSSDETAFTAQKICKIWKYLKLFLQKYDRFILIVYVDNFPEKLYFKIKIEVEWFQNNKIPTYNYEGLLQFTQLPNFWFLIDFRAPVGL